MVDLQRKGNPISGMWKGGDRKTDFFEKLPLLNDVGDSLLLDALGLVDILEGKKLL